MSQRGGKGRGPPKSRGRGRGKGPFAAGPVGMCYCPNCGTEVPHQAGIPCNQKNCPECGTRLARKQ